MYLPVFDALLCTRKKNLHLASSLPSIGCLPGEPALVQGNKWRTCCTYNTDLNHKWLAAGICRTVGRKATGVSLVDRMGLAEIIQRELFHPKIFLKGISPRNCLFYTQLPLKIYDLVPGHKHSTDEVQ